MVIAIIVLFILHFCQPKAEAYIPSVPEGKAGTGEILYVNIDSINEHYELIKILKDELEAAGFEVYCVGDCAKPWNIAEAIASGNLTARKI